MVAVCTYRRNEPLRRLLTAIVRNAAVVAGRARVGVVVVDDNKDQRARSVCDDFATAFTLGLIYRTSGQGNISIGRNLALEAAIEHADWVAMTDDDCVPVDDWLSSYLDGQAATGADALTGPCILTVPATAPTWLSRQPFLEDGQFRFHDHHPMTTAATNNSFFRASFFRDRPHLRFEPELGIVGGEDMVFFRTAHRAGLEIRFSTPSVVAGMEPPERQTFRYQLKSHFWLGNTEFVTNKFLGDAKPARWTLRAFKAVAQSAARPIYRLTTGRSPQLRYALAGMFRGFGMLFGALGLKLRHH